MDGIDDERSIVDLPVERCVLTEPLPTPICGRSVRLLKDPLSRCVLTPRSVPTRVCGVLKVPVERFEPVIPRVPTVDRVLLCPLPLA